MSDDGFLLHGVVAFFVPSAWAVILYPYCRLLRKDWRIMLLFAIGFSFAVMVVKELFDSRVSTNDIVADLLGLFFGTTLVAALFAAGGKHLSRQGFSAIFNRKISLRDALAFAKRIELRAASFYEGVAYGTSDPRVKEGCLITAGEERKHAGSIQKVLDRWLSKPPKPCFIAAADKEFESQGFFTMRFAKDASAESVLQYAVETEGKLGEFYSSFEKVFPDEWKKEYVRRLVRAEEEHQTRMKELLQRMSGNEFRGPVAQASA